MSEFNWNHFYDELETDDPQRFPFWMFMFHEISGWIGSAFTGIIMAIFFVIVIGATLGVLAHSYPDWTFKIFQHAVCSTP